MMPGAMSLRGPPGQGTRSGVGMRGPMGRGDYGKFLVVYAKYVRNKTRSLVCLLVK